MNLTASRSAQYPLVTEFTFNYNNFVVDSADGTKKTFGSTVAASTDPSESGLTGPVANTVVFDFATLPPGAVVCGGEVIVETAVAGSTASTLKLGIAGADATLLASTSMMTAARTALLLTSALTYGGEALRATFAYTVANATAGKVRIRVMYTVDGRAQEAL